MEGWLENQNAMSDAKPDGLSNGTSSGAWKETCRRATALVESKPMYDLIKPRLIDWVTINFPKIDSFELCQLFERELCSELLRTPFYATTTAYMIDQARKDIDHKTVDVVANELNVKRQTLRNALDRLKITLPYGSYVDDKHRWHIHPLDVPSIRSMFESKQKSA